MKKKHWIIIGSGFRGLMGAYLLAKRGENVTIIDKAKKIGGVLSSESWQGFSLDKGCHLFDNDEDDITSLFLEIMDEEVVPVKVKYASFLNSTKTDGISIADINSCGEETSSQILWELLAASQKDQGPQTSLEGLYQKRFGYLATEIIDKLLKKTHLHSASELDPFAFDLLPFKRIKFTNDHIGRILKQSQFLDERVAISSADNMMQFYSESATKFPSRNFYPAKNGLTHFCIKVREKLEALGVEIRLGQMITNAVGTEKGVSLKVSEEEIIEGDYMLWAGAQELLPSFFRIESKLKELVVGIPMALFYFVVDIDQVSDLSYIHNFEKDKLIFRASIPYNYGNKTGPEGKTFICCEVPASVNDAVWKDAKGHKERVWNELLNMGLVVKGSYESALAISIPSSYKVPLKGYGPELEKVISQINTNRIFGLYEWEFSKNNIVRTLNQVLHNK